MSSWTWDKYTKKTKGSETVRFDFGRRYNGSGPTAFGGAPDWPTLSIDIDFPVGQEARRLRIAARIRNVLSDEGIIGCELPTVRSDRCCFCENEARPGKITCEKCKHT